MTATPPELWGESESLLKAKEHLSQAARIARPVLLLGERGTGKELAAARLHYLSPRWQAPYLTLNCAALSPGLLESELFGHEAGAFTGAGRRRPGRFEAADGGSLFLDEISHLSLEAQAKILRVVEYGSFQPVGGQEERRVDVRLISASNVDLWALAEAGKFLPDLLDRLSFEVIELPPLRGRRGDVTLLAHRFAARMALELGLDEPPAFSPAALENLELRPWPGNVRELKNVVERAVYHSQGRQLEPEDFLTRRGSFPPWPQPPNSSPPMERPRPLPWPLAPGEFDRRLAEAGLSLMDQAIIQARRNQKEAARLLGLTYNRFRFLRQKFKKQAE